MGIHRPWRHALLGVAVATAAVGTTAGSAAAAIGFDTTTDTSLALDGDAHWFAQRATPQTIGNYQYTAYWDAESPGRGDPAPLKVTRRLLSRNTLESAVPGGNAQLTDPDDGHNQLAMGLSPNDGRIHLSWSTHNDEHQYVQSSAGCMTETTFSNCRWTYTNAARTAGIADTTHESNNFTYPVYFRAPSGQLYLTFRYGSSLNGDQYLFSYNDNGTWTSVGLIIQGRSGGGTYTDPSGQRTTERGVYPVGFEVDSTGVIQMMWAWRENGTPQGTYMYNGLQYAYSRSGGRTWNNGAGTSIATAGSDPLKVNDPGLEVADLPFGWHASPASMALDSHRQPHAVLVSSDVNTTDLMDGNLRALHVWQTLDGTWHEDWIQPAGGSTAWYEIGELFFDRGDTAYYIWNENPLGWIPSNVDESYQDELRWDHMTWQGGSYIEIRQMTGVTNIDTYEHVNTAVSTAGNNQIRVRMSSAADESNVAFWWSTSANPTWDAARSQAFTVTNDGNWHDYTFRITDSDWRGTLRDLEFQPVVGGTADAGDIVKIDWIRITDSSGNIVRRWEFDDGPAVKMAQTDPAGNWTNGWEINTLLSDVSPTFSDSYYDVDRQRYEDAGIVSFPVQEQGSPFTETMTLHEFDVISDTTIKYWDFAVDSQAWAVGGDVSGFGWISDSGTGSVSGTITGTDSRIYSMSDLDRRIDATVAPKVHVRMKNTSSATTARVYFVTDRDGTFNTTKSKSVSITPNSGYTDYVFDMSGTSGWTTGHILERLRIDPADDGTTRSGSFAITRVYVGA